MAVIKPRPKPKPKAKPKPKPGHITTKQGGGRPRTPPPATASTTTTTASTAGHPTLDVAGMQDGQQAQGDVTQVTTEGGPGQEGAVFSTGPSSAEMLHYQQATTYQQVYADQQTQDGGGQ